MRPRYEPTPGAAAPRGFPLRAAACLLLSLAGGFVYVALLGVPLLRSTGLPAFVIMGAAAIAGVLAVRRDRRLFPRLLALGNLALLGIFTFSFFWVWALPLPAETATALQVAPEFELPDESGRIVSLKDARRGGPVLLVFYRGFW
ncbi:MAG: hypothetical protein CHACPFDD_03675 [Phycisphaerae bacterium]|nr:hypothetical protein [Phycisphaerae bacterium]